MCQTLVLWNKKTFLHIRLPKCLLKQMLFIRRDNEWYVLSNGLLNILIPTWRDWSSYEFAKRNLKTTTTTPPPMKIVILTTSAIFFCFFVRMRAASQFQQNCQNLLKKKRNSERERERERERKIESNIHKYLLLFFPFFILASFLNLKFFVFSFAEKTHVHFLTLYRMQCDQKKIAKCL